MNLLPHQERMKDEAQQLAERAQKLAAFMQAPTFQLLSPDEHADMRDQLAGMQRYLNALSRRLTRINAQVFPPMVVNLTSRSDQPEREVEPIFGTPSARALPPTPEQQAAQDARIAP